MSENPETNDTTILGSATTPEPESPKEPEAQDPVQEPAQPEPEPQPESEPEAPEWSVEDLEVPDWMAKDERLGSFAEMAKEMGLDATNAQKMLDIYRQVREDEVKTFKETKARWAEESKKLLGENADEKLAIVAKALDGLDPEVTNQFRSILDVTAVGDHPAVVQVLYELAKQAVGGGFVQGKPARPEKKKSITEIFYGKE